MYSTAVTEDLKSSIVSKIVGLFDFMDFAGRPINNETLIHLKIQSSLYKRAWYEKNKKQEESGAVLIPKARKKL
jgi:hypothetical protein